MYRDSGIGERLLSIALVPFYLLWKLAVLIVKGLARLVLDVAKNVYGRVVIALGAIVFAGLAVYFSHFLR
jgi:hypothetical protein